MSGNPKNVFFSLNGWYTRDLPHTQLFPGFQLFYVFGNCHLIHLRLLHYPCDHCNYHCVCFAYGPAASCRSVAVVTCFLRTFSVSGGKLQFFYQKIYLWQPQKDRRDTIWLWHCQFAMERSTIFKFGKPSIWIRAINKPWLCKRHNPRLIISLF